VDVERNEGVRLYVDVSKWVLALSVASPLSSFGLLVDVDKDHGRLFARTIDTKRTLEIMYFDRTMNLVSYTVVQSCWRAVSYESSAKSMKRLAVDF
jgi:hypothetical protein